MTVVEVAVPLRVAETYSYAVPDHLTARVAPGKRVAVPFGRRTVTGYVLGPGTPMADLREVAEILDEEPLFTAQELEFLRWAARYYHHPVGEVIRAALPAALAGKEGVDRGKVLRETWYAATVAEAAEKLKPKDAALLELLREKGELSLPAVREVFPGPLPRLRRLEELGLVASQVRERYRDPFREEVAATDRPLALNEAQRKAVEAVTAAAGSFSPFLLHGVTGSGKTEVYLQAIAAVVDKGGGALVLVPEIALTPQLVRRFRRRFSCGIAVLHSGLSDGERFDEWRRIRRGEARIVIGARSAIFAPVDSLAIIVVDEEHDGSYKQSEGFRYNGRDLALVRGKQWGVPVILGSATPAVTTFHAAAEERLRLLELPVRVLDRPLPEVRLVDMRGRRRELLSPELRESLARTLAAGGQSLLFLNRRGFATYLACEECGEVLRCPNCSVTLTFHKRRGRSFCHYCDFSIPSPTLCPGCRGGNVSLLGFGTERVEEEVAALFPEARVARMDRDTTSGKGGHERVLKRLERGETDILIGTQMIAKGHDFPGVTLVGVLSAEGSLNVPDFRSGERTFQVLTQVIGRAGRGDAPGLVLVQSLVPDHYAVECALAHDVSRFYREELEYRRELSYPPFSHLAAIHFSGNVEERVAEGAHEGGRVLRELREVLRLRVEVLGPAPAPLVRIRGRFRWQCLLKSPRRDSLHELLTAARRRMTLPSGVRMALDVDPLEML